MNKFIPILFLSCYAVTANSQTTDFIYRNDNNSYCAPVDVQFVQTSSGTPVGYLWDFGNGTRSNVANPTAIYISQGTYTVRLITVYAHNTAEMTKTITINPSITTSFTLDRNHICKPGIVNLAASSIGGNGNYDWDFGDGTPVFTTTQRNITHNFTDFGEFTITLTTTNSFGCNATYTRTLEITKPVISGSVTNTSGCIPVTSAFNSHVSVPAGSTISSYLWNFGDGHSLTTGFNHTSHNFTNAGSFLPTLTVTTVDGCTNTFSFDSVALGTPPTNHRAYPLDTVLCGSETPIFVSVATNANRYDWDFGGGTITSVTDTIVEHRYSNLGFKGITVTPMFNGCAGTPISFRINIIGVIAKYNYRNTCNDKKTFTFKNTSDGNISTILWEMGDNTTSHLISNFSHNYPNFGTFPVRLYITDSITGCVDSLTKKLYTADPLLINPDSSICINSNTSFNILNNYQNPHLSYEWNVIGQNIGSDTNASPILTADSLGHFNTNFVIIDNGVSYCPDSIYLAHPITVRGPQLDFTAPLELCLNTPLTVTNLSHAFQPSDTVRVWYWNFGRIAASDTIFQPAPYTYIRAKIYNVKLTAVDKFGCLDSLVKKVTIRPMPFLWIIPREDTVCLGQSSAMIAYTSDNVRWSPAAPGLCVTCDSVTIRPVETTRFLVTSTNDYNCSVTDSAFIKVFTPFTATAGPDTSVCASEKVTLDVEPKHMRVVWSSTANISNANIYTPIVSPQHTSVYTASLSDSAGCFSSSADVKVIVKTPASVNAGADKTLSYNAPFSIHPVYSNNIRSFNWSPADSLSCSTCAYPTSIASTGKTYTVTVTSDSGCVASDNISISIECRDANLLMPTAFSPNNDGLNDVFGPIARGIKNITKFTIYNRAGQVMYEARNFLPNKKTIGWDGKYKGQDQPGAAYIYIVEAVCDMNQTLGSKGSFILMR